MMCAWDDKRKHSDVMLNDGKPLGDSTLKDTTQFLCLKDLCGCLQIYGGHEGKSRSKNTGQEAAVEGPGERCGDLGQIVKRKIEWT